MVKENEIIIWKKIKILHDKANTLMNNQRIIQNGIKNEYKKLATHKSTTKIYKNVKIRILNMENRYRNLSKQLTDVLRKKDLLLKKVK